MNAENVGDGEYAASPESDENSAGAGPAPALLPHPVTGRLFPSPVPPGTGWPGDAADADTPVAHTAADARRIARAARSLPDLQAASTVCRACPRLVAWREEVAARKVARYADQPYWGRPAASFGDDAPRLIVLGLAPAAQGANRTGRMFTGDRSGSWIIGALHRAGLATQPTSVAQGDGLRLLGARLVAPVRCAPPQNAPSAAERATCAGWLDAELALLPSVEAVLALGGIAWQAALQAARRAGWEVPRPQPRFGHGVVAELGRPGGPPVRLVGCYHVSQQNTFTGRLTEPMLDEAIALATA